MWRLALLLAAAFATGCAGLAVRPAATSIDPIDAATIAADVANLVATHVPSTAESIWISPPTRSAPASGVEAGVAAALREFGFAIAEQAEAPQGSARLTIALDRSGAEAFLVVKLGALTASRLYARSGGRLEAVSPFSLRGVDP